MLLGDPADLKGDAEAMFAQLPSAPVLIKDEATLDDPPILALFEETELFLDAVVGTGFQPPLRGVAAALAERINALEDPVVAVDIPSGWDADSREPDSPGAFRANAVVTFTAPKLAHLFGNMTRGGIVVAPIGSPDEGYSIHHRTHLGRRIRNHHPHSRVFPTAIRECTATFS